MTATENFQSPDGSITSRRSNSYIDLAVGAATVIAAILSNVEILAAIGLGLFGYSIFWFVRATGEEITIAPVVSMIATAQWILGPYLAYYHDAVTLKYRMYVDESTYFEYIVPSLLLFVSALRIFSPKITIFQIKYLVMRTSVINKRNVYYIFMIGLLAQLASSSLPSSFKFILFLVSQFTFIASIYLIVLRMKYRWICLSVSFIILGIISLEYSLFHVILLWSALVASYICAELGISFRTKLIVFIASVLFLAQLQAAKSEYRLRIYQNPDSAGFSTLIDVMVQNSLFQNSEFSSTAIDSGNLNARLNQGWIISAVMNYVPAARDFENGETILRAFQDSLLPRFLFDKRTIDVSAGFEKYTGLTVSKNTSFGISVVGEAWVNFGYFGIIFMGAFGAFYGLVLKLVVTIARRFPTVIFWIPLIFLQATKAETETVVVLNHIVKSGALVAMIYVMAYKVLKWRI